MITKDDIRTLMISLTVCSSTLAFPVSFSDYEIDAAWIEEKQEILQYLSLIELDDGAGGTVKTIRVTGVNLQIVNGLGATNGNPGRPEETGAGLTATTGTGNVIIGYNEMFFDFFEPGPFRTGSHNLIGGASGEYTSFGGIVSGRESQATAAYASVLGGVNNKAFGEFSVVVGGGTTQDGSTVGGNRANATFSTIMGGGKNVAGSSLSFVGGGGQNKTGGVIGNCILGGSFNVAAGSGSVVCGGESNRSADSQSHVCGGEDNTANGEYSNVSGGQFRKATNSHYWRAGSLVQQE